MKRKNRLITIGYRGIKRAYFNLTMTEAVERYRVEEGEPADPDLIAEIEFDDSFGCYEAWATEEDA